MDDCKTVSLEMDGEILIAYQASFQPFSREDRHFVKIYNLEDEVNNNNWGVTSEARARSLRSFFNQPLLGPMHLSNEHVVDSNPAHPHFGVWAKIGRPVDVINNGGMYGIYEVTVPKAWELIQAGQLRTVSPSIHVKQHQFTPDGKEIITDFDWDHTLFVDVGAIPKAGVVATCTASDPSLCGFRQAVQAALKGQHVDAQTNFDLSEPGHASDVQEGLRQAEFGYKRDWTQIDPATGLGKIVDEENNILAGGGIFQEILRSELCGYARDAQGRQVALESLFPQQQIAQASKTLRALGAL